LPDFFQQVFASGQQASALDVFLRLLAAFAYGLVIAAIYRWTRGQQASVSFAMTLLLLSVLIAMVTQVIGDNVARAFSLVGALSIVRFRTVVRDTQDTAYVILAVIVGMAVGAWSLWVASIGIAVVALAEGVIALGGSMWQAPAKPLPYEVRVRSSAEQDLHALVLAAIKDRVHSIQLQSLGIVKQGEYLEATYWVSLPIDASLPQLMRALSDTPGLNSVMIAVRKPDSD
jgi:hypothetical protein